MKSQNTEIRNIIQEIRDIQDQTTRIVGEIKRIDVDVEDRIFNDAKKDKLAKEIYKEVVTLKESFDFLITSV